MNKVDFLSSSWTEKNRNNSIMVLKYLIAIKKSRKCRKSYIF